MSVCSKDPLCGAFETLKYCVSTLKKLEEVAAKDAQIRVADVPAVRERNWPAIANETR